MSESNSNQRKVYKPYTATTGKVFINEFKRHDRDEGDPLYFVNVGLITGKEGSGKNAKSRIQYLDLLVGQAVKSVAENIVESGVNPFDGTPVEAEIYDLFITGAQSGDGNDFYLNSKGVLNAISIQYS